MATQATHPLPLTGERTLPGVPTENYWFRRHEVVYRLAAAMAADRGWRAVLDAGCGEGYGAAMLARAGARVVAVDLDAASVVHAAGTYPEMVAVRANLVGLPLPDGSCDAVVSLQVIEHLWDVDAYLDEVARVLAPGGTFVCSTPNRLTFSPGRDTPLNPFHAVEFTAEELAARMGPRFGVAALGGVWHAARLARVDAASRATLPALLHTDAWPGWLATLVADVGVDDFTVAWPGAHAELADSLDLVAVGRRR